MPRPPASSARLPAVSTLAPLSSPARASALCAGQVRLQFRDKAIDDEDAGKVLDPPPPLPPPAWSTQVPPLLPAVSIKVFPLPPAPACRRLRAACARAQAWAVYGMAYGSA